MVVKPLIQLPQNKPLGKKEGCRDGFEDEVGFDVGFEDDVGSNVGCKDEVGYADGSEVGASLNPFSIEQHSGCFGGFEY